MKEKEWLKETHPRPLLHHLRHHHKRRQRRLFACACCRRVWTLLKDVRSREGVKVAEKFVDGEASKTDLQLAHHIARAAAWDLGCAVMAVPVQKRNTPWTRMKAAEAVVHATASRGTADAVDDAADGSFVDLRQMAEERQAQADLLRDIFGNPFRAVRVAPAVLRWEGCTVRKLAEAAYEERSLPDGTLDTARLRVLADALEEAGCTETAVLNHLRGTGMHVRGCWVLDRVLSKDDRN
jgi:hypothetical protein